MIVLVGQVEYVLECMQLDLIRGLQSSILRVVLIHILKIIRKYMSSIQI